MADKLLKSIKFPTLPDRYVIGDSTLTEEGAAADAKAVGDALATKADTSGTYEDLIVGGAEQLMADGYETDKDPYLFRSTGGSADVGNREYVDKIVGGTVAWNQIADNAIAPSDRHGLTFSVSIDSFTVNGTAKQSSFAAGWFRLDNTTVIPLANHVLFYSYGLKSGSVSNVAGTLFAPIAEHQSFKISIGQATVKKMPSALSTNTGKSVWDYVQDTVFTDAVLYVQTIDLTAMFGTTIADYIYSLEQSQAGAGVAWFRNYFPKDYYPYDPGTLRSVEGVSAHETVGFNQWDEEWESGYYDASGNAKSSSAQIRSKNLIQVIPNAEYYTKMDAHRFCFYDSSKTFIGRSDLYQSNQHLFTVPSNCHYIKFHVDYTGTYNHDICINLSDPTRNGEYEPYQKHTYSLDSSLTLRGVPKLADGKLAFDGDVYPPSGEVQRRYGVVDLGTLNWARDTDYSQSVFVTTTNLHTIIAGYNIAYESGICSKGYVFDSAARADYHSIDKIIGITNAASVSNYMRIFIADSSYTDAEAFKTAMSGVYLVYEKATPTTETADGYEHYQICDPSGTEEFVTTGIVPVGHETRYPHDLKKKIETAPDSPSTDGTYLMKRSGGKNTYMALPSTPSANGSYVLTVTVSGGNASYSWTAKE